MAGSRNCNGGTVSTQTTVNPDCDCVGVKKVVFNTDKTMTITLTNGVSYTSPVLTGPAGATGATGATGAAGASGGELLWNELGSPSSTSNSWATLSSFPMDADQLANDEDELRMHLSFQLETLASPPNPGPDVRVTFAGLDLWVITTPATISFSPAGATIIDIDIRISRAFATSIKYSEHIVTYIDISSGQGLLQATAAALQQEFSYPVPDLTTTAIAINADVKSIGGATITLLEYEILYFPKKQ